MVMSRYGSSNRTNNTMSPKDKQQWQSDISAAVPIIDDRLYFTVAHKPAHTSSIHMFSIDHALRYEPFFVDFGPLNLACLYKFCKLLDHKLSDEKLKEKKIYYFCDRSPQRISNAAYLIGAYQLISLKRSPAEAFRRIKQFSEKGVPFRDASMGLCTYHCKVEHCLDALYNAMQWNWLDFSRFNVDEYEHYERVECGDLNVIIPNKFVAFAGPNFKEFDEEGYPALTPDFYVPIWNKFKVTTIIRLNKKCYDKRIFTKAGFDHHDMYFIDGTTPSDEIIAKFNSICENAKGMLAVHCKAGLGRTGSCVGCYMMKHYAWTAHDVIAWMRICRPGSVIGPQQQFLERQQPRMWKLGDEYRKKNGIQLVFDRRQQLQHSVDEEKGQNQPQQKQPHHIDDDDDIKMDSSLKTQQHQPLATDPGQNQGAALRQAKASGQHHLNNHNQKKKNNSQNSQNGGKGNLEISQTSDFGNLQQKSNRNANNNGNGDRGGAKW